MYVELHCLTVKFYFTVGRSWWPVTYLHLTECIRIIAFYSQ